jgi:phage-related minor tail protein
MKTPRTVLFSALLLACSFGATAAPLSKVDYKSAKSDIENKYKADKKACNVHADNAKDICVEEAKGAERVAKAELEANYEPSAKHTIAVQEAKAKATLAIAKEKCDDQNGNAKDVCRKEAQAAYTSDMAKAKLTEKTGEINNKAASEIKDTQNTATDKKASARKEANDDIRDADYKTALQKCDAYARDVKANCIAEARTRFNK